MRAGLGDIVDVVEGRAAETLAALPRPYDLVFLDADRPSDTTYLDLVVPRLRAGGLLIADNVTSHAHELRDYVQRVKAQPDLFAVTVPIGNGEEIALKLDGPVRARLAESLGEHGYTATTPEPEDWGWYIDVGRAGASYLVGASGESTTRARACAGCSRSTGIARSRTGSPAGTGWQAMTRCRGWFSGSWGRSRMRRESRSSERPDAQARASPLRVQRLVDVLLLVVGVLRAEQEGDLVPELRGFLLDVHHGPAHRQVVPEIHRHGTLRWRAAAPLARPAPSLRQ